MFTGFRVQGSRGSEFGVQALRPKIPGLQGYKVQDAGKNLK